MNAKTATSLRGRYHAIFGELCRQFDWPKTSESRHQLTEWILGYSKSSSQFAAKEYCLIIDQMQDWIRGDIQPHELTKYDQRNRSYNEHHKQLIYAIEHLGAPNAYIQAIANDRHSKRPWRDLGAVALSKLRMTITARVAAARKKGQPITSLA